MERKLRVPEAKVEFALESISTDRTEVAPRSNVVGKYLESGLAHGL